ncbi:hypothetical protein EDB89DRAFT_2075051 [Lactarius sanguifluus]|nr:hypothetical protein EDB89DRAFT_2075051 [Lactarius sanguifluus]
MSLVHKLGMLEFDFWDKDLVRNDYPGGKLLPINDWVKGTVFAFDDPDNRLCLPPNSTGLPDFERIYNALANTVLALEDKDHVGVIEDLSDFIRLTVFNGDKFTPNSYIGEAEIDIASLIERARTKDLNTMLHPNYIPTIREFSLPLISAKKPGRVCKTIATIPFRASYQPYDALGKQVEQRARRGLHASDLARRAHINAQVSWFDVVRQDNRPMSSRADAAA